MCWTGRLTGQHSGHKSEFTYISCTFGMMPAAFGPVLPATHRSGPVVVLAAKRAPISHEKCPKLHDMWVKSGHNGRCVVSAAAHFGLKRGDAQNKYSLPTRRADSPTNHGLGRSCHQLRRLCGPRPPGARERARVGRKAGALDPETGCRVPSCLSRAPRRTASGPQQQLRHGDLATVGMSRPVPTWFVVGRVEESISGSQQLQHPLRGYACDPRSWNFLRASRVPCSALARARVCAPRRARRRARRRRAARRAAHLPEQVLRRGGAARAHHAAAGTDASTQRVANSNPHTPCALASLAGDQVHNAGPCN